MNCWEIRHPAYRGQWVGSRPVPGLARFGTQTDTVRFGTGDGSLPDPAPKPQPSKGLGGWISSWLPSSASKPEAQVTSPSKPTAQPEKPEKVYLKRIQTIIAQHKPVSELVTKLQREISLPTYQDHQLPEKLARFMADHEGHRDTTGDGNIPTQTDYYRINFNELDSTQPELQQRALRFFIKEFMNSGLQHYYPNYFKTRSPKDYQVLQQHVGESYSAYKGAFVDSPEFFLEKLREVSGEEYGSETPFIRALAFDDAYRLLSVVIHTHARQVAEHKAFPDFLESDEDADTRQKALETAMDLIYHPEPATRKTAIHFFKDIALEARESWIEKTLTHYTPIDS